MWKTNLIIAVRVLGRNKTISLINITGLSVAFAVAVLCLLFVRHQTSFDTWHEKGDRIFAVYHELLEPEPGASFNRSTIKGYRLDEGVDAKVAGIRESVSMQLGYGKVSYGDVIFDQSFLAVDPAFLTMFTLPLAAGDAATALDDTQSVVLSHETALKYFSPDVPAHALLGKRIRLHTVERDYSTSPLKETPIEVECTITGVLAPLPGPSILHIGVLVPAATAETLHFRGLSGLFVELEEGVEPTEVETRLASPSPRHRLKLQPFAGAHLGPRIQGPVSLGYGSVEQIYLLAGLAALVLLIAAINFVNLAMSRAMTRTLEIGVRKVIGATRRQLSNQFLAEAIVVSLISIVVGMGLAEVVLPTFNELMHWPLMYRQLEIEWLSVETGIGALTLAWVVGVLSGLYPAQVVARLHPVRALSQKTPRSGRGLLGRGLIVVQFALSAVLVVVTITMARQLDFMRTKDLGFDGDQVLLVGHEGFIEALQIEHLANEIKSRPGLVRGVTGASAAPGAGGYPLMPIQSDEKVLYAKPFSVSPNFLSIMGIEVLSGQGFDPNLPHGVLLNETAARFFGPEGLIGRTLTFSQKDGEPMTVIGIVEDFHFVGMRHTIGPAFLTALKLGSDRFAHTLFRLDRTDLPAGVEEVKALWKRVLPEHGLHDVRFLDEAFAARYETEQHVGLVMGWMSAVAIVISCMGLFGLVALATVRRTKEIGIRKVLGATTGSVLLLMSREFGWLVVVANVIAWPVAYFVLNRWLALYAYRVDMGLGWFVLAGVGVLAIALATVSGQTWLAARTNPADALRYE